MAFLYQVPQATVIIFERLGRFHRIAQSGLRVRLPLLDSAKRLNDWPAGCREYNGRKVLIELSEQHTDTKPRTIITRDNVEMMADASVYWQIVDPARAVYEVDNLPVSITDLAVTTLRNLLGATTLNDALGARDGINEGLLAEIDATSRKWGVRVNRVELQELRAANPEASGAMLQQMASEREREATVARAEGERRARGLRAEGTASALRTLVEADLDVYRRASAIMGTERAYNYLLSLKYLETLERIAESPSTKLFLPAGANMNPLIAGALAEDRPAPPPASTPTARAELGPETVEIPAGSVLQAAMLEAQKVGPAKIVTQALPGWSPKRADTRIDEDSDDSEE